MGETAPSSAILFLVDHPTNPIHELRKEEKMAHKYTIEILHEPSQQQRDALHLAIIEDFSNVIAKHLPNFDNNISNETWQLLELFTEETIYQLTKEEK
jgi:hypothetical protein